MKQDVEIPVAAAVYVCPMHPHIRQPQPGRCPECGMNLVPEAEAKSGVQAGHAHHQTQAKAPSPEHAADAPTVYTCPMHPEIRQDQPGKCPKCGMTLEPLLPELEADENPELRDSQRRCWWTLPLSVVVTMQAMAGHRLQWFEMATQSWIELVLTLPVVLWAGWPFFERGAQSLVNRSPNKWTLIGPGTGAAFVYSVVATMALQLFPACFLAMGRVAVYSEAAGMGCCARPSRCARKGPA